MRGSINSYDTVPRYSVDVSVLLLCVITRPFSHCDDDLLPCVTALLSELVNKEKLQQTQSGVKTMRDYAYTRVHRYALTCRGTRMTVFSQACVHRRSCEERRTVTHKNTQT